MTVYTERALCDAIIIAPAEGCIRRCNRTAQAGGAMCEKHKGTEAWQATLQKVLVPNWSDLIRVAPVKRAAPALVRGPMPTLKVKRPAAAAPVATAAPVPTAKPAPAKTAAPPRVMPAAPLLRPASKPQPAPQPAPAAGEPAWKGALAAFAKRG